MKDWFKLRGDLEGSSKYIATAIGFVLTILLWWVLAEIFSKNRPIYPGEDNTTMELIDSNIIILQSFIYKRQPGGKYFTFLLAQPPRIFLGYTACFALWYVFITIPCF